MKNKYQMRTFRLDISGLFKPLIFRFSGYKGDFNVYFSAKHDIPSDEYGFEQRGREEDEIIYPKRMKDILQGTMRWEKNKTVNISLETSEPCQIMIDIA